MKQEDVKLIVVHCSATPPSMDVDIRDVDRWHRQKGWLKVGYHYFIKRSGELQEGRQLTEAGAHVKGHNHESVGICLAGGLSEVGLQPEDNFLPVQKQALKSLLAYLQKYFEKAVIGGHRDYNPHKDCPCFEVQELIKVI